MAIHPDTRCDSLAYHSTINSTDSSSNATGYNSLRRLSSLSPNDWRFNVQDPIDTEVLSSTGGTFEHRYSSTGTGTDR